MSAVATSPSSRVPGILLVASGVLAIAALAIPDAWPVVTARALDAVDVVHTLRAGYQLSSVLWALTGIAALLGVNALGAYAGRPLVTTGVGVLSGGIILWIVALVTMSTNILMSDAQGGTAKDLSYLVLGEIGHVLWLVAFLTMAAGFGVLVFALRDWSRWVCAAVALGLVILVAVVHDIPPFTVFLLALPALGVASLTAKRATAR
ncbi:MAG: hypothetical protein ABIR17_04625 [Pseudolysinimonas sp.]|uniref:hypothetical protein n=1 Tax=Pseudolysinimonas sp. TaxID=2680009 RepID=UPI0032669481